MITKTYITVIAILSLIGISLSSCKSLSKTELLENPDFFKNGKEYSLKHSFPQVLTFDLINVQNREQHFIVQDKQTGEDFRFVANYVNTTSEAQFLRHLKIYQDDKLVDDVINSFFIKIDSFSNLEEESLSEVREFNGNNFFYQGLTFYNPLNELNYFVLSKVYYYRDRLQIDQPSIIDKSYLIFPIDFWIYEGNKEIGSISFKISYAEIDKLSYALTTDIHINNKILNSKFYGGSYKIKVAFDSKDQLIAYFELKPPKAAAVNEPYRELIGNVLIKENSSKQSTSEIFTTYIIVNQAFNYLKTPTFDFDEEWP